ncbi:unnamed protein product [Rhizoctonia solani]|uniref:Uncharacterized protein n=1 Tax=Rhizoctonia solani TaxID=456999 RepID=A0A8H3BUM6_9AGAM|nr:unnamed protein product [Rhizoctonia solani]
MSHPPATGSSSTNIPLGNQDSEAGWNALRDEWYRAADTLVDNHNEVVSPSREHIDRLYRIHVHNQDPGSQAWLQDTFEKHWKDFLIAHGCVKQSCVDLVWLAGKHMVNSSGARIGTQALAALYARMKHEFYAKFNEPLSINHFELMLMDRDRIQQIIVQFLRLYIFSIMNGRIGGLRVYHTDEEYI